MAEFKLSDDDKASIKATVNIMILLILFISVNWIFDLHITVDDLKWWLPIIAVVVGIFYRLSLFISYKYPPIGYVLFGIKGSTFKDEKLEDGS
jgi:1,4-dihydroxy-2-naphthoate octaprenyltransferase